MESEREKLNGRGGGQTSDAAMFLFPFAAIFQKRWFFVLVLALSCYQMYRGVSAPVISGNYGVSTYQSFRLLQPSSNATSAIAAFVLTSSGCDIDTAAGPCAGSAAATATAGWECVLSAAFPAPQDFDGFRLVLAPNRSAASGPVGFLLQGRAAAVAAPWVDVGTPLIRLTRDGVLRQAYRLPDGRRKDLTLMALTRPEWEARSERA